MPRPSTDPCIVCLPCWPFGARPRTTEGRGDWLLETLDIVGQVA